jgi:ABC-2 type transport system permease protein
MAAFGLSLILAYFVCFFLKLTLGFTAFWLTNIQGVISLFDVAVYLFGGILIPLALLPEPLQAFAQVLPLQAIFSFPLMVLLGRIQGDALVLGLAVQAGWILGLAGLAGTMWRSGLRRYEAVGG